jgi:hypothetical protein
VLQNRQPCRDTAKNVSKTLAFCAARPHIVAVR